MAWWPFRKRQVAIPTSRLEFVLYSRSGCHLCDAAETLLRDRQSRFAFGLDKVDVDTDPELARRYGECVPIVLVNGKLRFRGRVEPQLLDRLLNANSARS